MTAVPIRYQDMFYLLALLAFVPLTIADLTCTSCQGTAGSECDVAPWKIRSTVPCSGRCMTWRSLYATGRATRTVWKGCDTTLIPGILSQSNRDTCSFGNFFVECTRTCTTPYCNQNHTGIPHCWSCYGDYQSCDADPPTNCVAPVIAAPPAVEVQCISCEGEAGSQCDIAPYSVTKVVQCNNTCITWKSLHANDRTIKSVWRGCTEAVKRMQSGTLPSNVSPPIDSCEDVLSTQTVECTATCLEHRCNKYTTGFTDCWTLEGYRKPSCSTEAPSSGFNANLLPSLLPPSVQEPADDVYTNSTINCTSCGGTAGSDCDAFSFNIQSTVPCNGSCMTRRTLYANGRSLKSIWRGCDETLYPAILDERFRNKCQIGNIFVECTATCSTGDECNQNSTGIPPCWNCLGEERSCNVTSEEQCESPKPEVATRAPANIQCVTCSGVTGSSCDVTPHREADEFCTSACLSVKYLNLPNRTVTRVLRGCQTNLNIPAALTINTCTEDTVKDEVVCSTSCYDYKCNKYSSGIPSCWSEKGEIKPECEGTTPAIPQHLINPSRVSTKKPYSIQDAYGGDNYRGEWRPPEEDQNSTSTNQTVKWKRNYENEGPYFGQTYKNQAESVIKANGIVYLFFIHLTLLYIIFLF